MYYGLPLSLRDDFRKGLELLRKEHVDVFIGNHQDQCDTLGKSARILAGQWDAFVDPTAWPAYLDSAEARLNRLLETEK